MARRKKRKYTPGTGSAPPPKVPPPTEPDAPTPPPDPPKPAGRPGSAPPPTEPPTEPPGVPEPIPPEAEIYADDRSHKLNRLYWLRIILAVAAGISATFIFEPFEGETRRWASIGYMIVLFAGTVFVAKTMRIPLSRADRKKIVTQALPSYVLMYLFVWVMSYTIVNASAPDAGMMSPLP